VKTCKQCGGEFEPRRPDQEYCTEKCRRAAGNDARRAQRALKHETNCKRCHLDLGPHHGNREYHPECQKAQEKESAQAKRSLDLDGENKKQRDRYARRRAKGPLFKVNCSYREKGVRVHTFKTRDRRLHYCCDEHRELGEAILQREADRLAYKANPQKHRDKNNAAAARRRGELAALRATAAAEGNALDLKKVPKKWRPIIPVLLDHPEWGNDRVREAAGSDLSDNTMVRVRRKVGVPGPKGRPAKNL
jgi:hypothetical protein